MGFYEDDYPCELQVYIGKVAVGATIMTDGWKSEDFINYGKMIRDKYKEEDKKIIIKAKYKGVSTLDYPATTYETWRNLFIDELLSM